MGQASVELIFDNTNAAAGGKLARYTELSLRRTVTRDRNSRYHLNGTRCRRRDIADIFLGTGLGANSYAVIEQGMIAHIVEAKPEEMRAYVEEAAGVSQYRERRRDTENRIRHTRDNLDRVLDIRDEVGKQIGRLKRQVKNAEKFKQLRHDKERFESELLLLRYKHREKERAACEKEVETHRLDFEKGQAALRAVEADAEHKRAAARECSDELNRIKEEYYRLGAKITGEEQDIENRAGSIERLRKESGEVGAMIDRNADARTKQQALLAGKEQRCAELDKEIERLSGEAERLREERAAAREVLRETALRHQDDIGRFGGEIVALRDKVHELVEALNAERDKRSDVQGRLASLEALQEAGLHSDEGAFARWLEAAGLDRGDCLVEQIRVADGWEHAIETVLGPFIGGVEVESLERHAARVGEFGKGVLALIEPGDGHETEAATLADKVSGTGSIAGLLGRVRIADDLDSALRRRSSLKAHESFITREGTWVGRNWIKRHVPGEDNESVILRERRIEELRARIKASDRVSAALGRDVEHARGDLARREAEREEVQSRLAAALKEAAALEGSEGQAGGSALEEARGRLRTAREALHRVEVERESAKVSHAAARDHLGQLQSLREELEQRRQSLNEALNELVRPMDESRQRLDALLSRYADENRRVEKHTRQLDELQSGAGDLERRRADLAGEAEARRAAYEKARAELQVISARCKDSLTEFNKLGVDSVLVERDLEAGISVEAQEEKLARVQDGMDRLGAINLVALEEFDELSERKKYLDSQHDDLERALKTLEEAIHKIDKETRARFRTTFDRINDNLHDTFPRLFGGGEANLELSDRDLLTTGVSIIVRPPGKRRASINLLSGGEKALAAAAVVFSIFELNPAPFCVLDEVDAPLDENNVERFCGLLKDMSERVQFVVITHNKLSMEYMDTLIGVTMQEPGVSRLVSVDVEEAEKMATA